MTYGEAYDYIAMSLHQDKYCIDEEKLYYARDLVDKACYLADKYRWNNLREDPNDLHQISDEDYLIAEEWIDGDRTYTIGNREYIWYHSTHNKLPFKVIGWGEINLFESEG